jgi:hypothetical protein
MILEIMPQIIKYAELNENRISIHLSKFPFYSMDLSIRLHQFVMRRRDTAVFRGRHDRQLAGSERGACCSLATLTESLVVNSYQLWNVQISRPVTNEQLNLSAEHYQSNNSARKRELAKVVLQLITHASYSGGTGLETWL